MELWQRRTSLKIVVPVEGGGVDLHNIYRFDDEYALREVLGDFVTQVRQCLAQPWEGSHRGPAVMVDTSLGIAIMLCFPGGRTVSRISHISGPSGQSHVGPVHDLDGRNGRWC